MVKTIDSVQLSRTVNNLWLRLENCLKIKITSLKFVTVICKILHDGIPRVSK